MSEERSRQFKIDGGKGAAIGERLTAEQLESRAKVRIPPLAKLLGTMGMGGTAETKQLVGDFPMTVSFAGPGIFAAQPVVTRAPFGGWWFGIFD